MGDRVALMRCPRAGGNFAMQSNRHLDSDHGDTDKLQMKSEEVSTIILVSQSVTRSPTCESK